MRSRQFNDRILYRFTRDVGGYPFLYADIFMTREEFEEMFDLTAYEKVRAKYFANGAFPHLYDKVLISFDKRISDYILKCELNVI